jgi:hypothetical protein
MRYTAPVSFGANTPEEAHKAFADIERMLSGDDLSDFLGDMPAFPHPVSVGSLAAEPVELAPAFTEDDWPQCPTCGSDELDNVSEVHDTRRLIDVGQHVGSSPANPPTATPTPDGWNAGTAPSESPSLTASSSTAGGWAC